MKGLTFPRSAPEVEAGSQRPSAYQKELVDCAEGARQFVTPANLRAADPMQQPLPAHARILLFAGTADTIVPPRYASAYAARADLLYSSLLTPNSPQAPARSRTTTVKSFPSAGHFDLVSPTSSIWPELLRQVSKFQPGADLRP